MLRYREIKRQIEQLAVSMQPGERIPSRAELCKSLDTTRATLDKAIKELTAQGRLVTRSGSGTYVAGEKKEAAEIRTIGLILPNNTISSYRLLISSVERFMQDKGVNVILCNSNGDVAQQSRYVTQLIRSKVSGIIIVPVLLLDVTQNYILYSSLMSENIPVIFCFRGIDGLAAPLVAYNNFYGGYRAVKHLIAKGYRNVAYLSQVCLRTSIDRFQGYVAALEENGLEIDRSHIMMGTDDVYGGMSAILTSGKPVDSVFCLTDEITPDVYHAIRDHDLRVSSDIGVIGYDDLDICTNLAPRLTTLGRKDDAIGRRAASLLWEGMENGRSKQFSCYVFQPEIIERESCLGPGIES